MTRTPEHRAREQIDPLPTAAGWIVQDNADIIAPEFVENLQAALEAFQSVADELEKPSCGVL